MGSSFEDFNFWCGVVVFVVAAGHLFLVPGWWRDRPAAKSRWWDRAWLVTVLAVIALFGGTIVLTIADAEQVADLTPWALGMGLVGVGLLLACAVPLVGGWRRFDFAVPPRLRTRPGPGDWAGPVTLAHGNRRDRRLKGRRQRVRVAGSYLRIQRPRHRWRDRFRAYRVEVDGEAVGTLRYGAELTVPVEPGRRFVRASIDWTGSALLDVAVPPGETVTLRVEPSSQPALQAAGTTDGYLTLTVEGS